MARQTSLITAMPTRTSCIHCLHASTTVLTTNTSSVLPYAGMAHQRLDPKSGTAYFLPCLLAGEFRRKNFFATFHGSTTLKCGEAGENWDHRITFPQPTHLPYSTPALALRITTSLGRAPFVRAFINPISATRIPAGNRIS